MECVPAELSFWTAGALRSRDVHEKDVTPDEEGKYGDGGWWGSLHHRLGGRARAEKEVLPEERECERERIEVPAARAVCSSGTYEAVDCLLLVISALCLFAYFF